MEGCLKYQSIQRAVALTSSIIRLITEIECPGTLATFYIVDVNIPQKNVESERQSTNIRTFMPLCLEVYERNLCTLFAPQNAGVFCFWPGVGLMAYISFLQPQMVNSGLQKVFLGQNTIRFIQLMLYFFVRTWYLCGDCTPNCRSGFRSSAPFV